MKIDTIHFMSVEKVIENKPTIPPSEANSLLNEYIQAMPPGKSTKSWLSTRVMCIDLYGEKSLANLLPEQTDRNTAIFTRTINTLARSKIRTKEDLRATTPETLSVIKQVGPEVFKLAMILKKIVSAEKVSA